LRLYIYFIFIIVVCPISVNFSQRIEIPRNERVYGVTKLRSEIFVLCRLSSPSPTVIRVHEDRNPFRCQRNITMDRIKGPFDIGSSEKNNCLYVCDAWEKCVWKITRKTHDQYNIVKWVNTYYDPYTLSVSINGQLLMVNWAPNILMIYGSDAERVRSIKLPNDIEKPLHAVETSTGNFIVLHFWVEKEKGACWSSRKELETRLVVSELSRDGQMVIRRFVPSSETQELKYGDYLSLDAEDRVFVADSKNDRVVLLDSDLKWNQILCPTQIEKEEATIRQPRRLCYDDERKQLIVGGYLEDIVNIYTLSGN